MKLLLLLLATVLSTQADIDWTKLKPVHLSPPKTAHLPGVRRLPVTRITGGDEAKPHSLPYQVGLFIPVDDGTAFCGGSLISTTTVLTAAHCAELSNSIEVRLGAHRIRDNEESQVKFLATDILVHPGWNSLLLENDLALIRLPAPVELNENIGLVKLPPRSELSNDFEGTFPTVSGWGLDSDSASTISDVLREVTVEVGNNFICNIYYLGAIQNTHICTSGEGGKSTCSGDSGGPLVLDGIQIGIVSFGISFGCEIEWPSVYTRVTEYVDWIEANSDVKSD